MRHERLHRALRAGRAAATLLRLESKVLTGNRLVVLVVVQLVVFGLMALWIRSQDQRTTASFYVGTVMLPGLLATMALGMSAVMAERDIRHLEMTLASPGGRYRVWAFRFTALALASAASALVFSLLSVALDRDVPPLTLAFHATISLVFVGAATVFLSLLFNGGASAALVVSGLCVGSFLTVHQAHASKWDVFVNPLDPPESLLDPRAWFRILVFNRGLFLALTGGCVAGSLWLLQRRERLL